MIDYSWVPWFRELVRKIAAGGPDYLVPRAWQVDWLKDNPPIHQYGDHNVDPFSFIYTLVSKWGEELFMRRLHSAHEAFAIDATLPPPPHIPTPNPINTLFHHDGDGRPDLLWQLFRQAVDDPPSVEAELFDRVLDIKNVAMPKLTQTLFVINANHFHPADGNLKRALGAGSSMVLPQSEFNKQPRNYVEYEACMEALKGSFPGCATYEINTFLDIQESRNPLITAQSRYFQVSTSVDSEVGHPGYWIEFDRENAVWTAVAAPPSGHPYPLDQPTRGDVILVRWGTRNGRGIGVVEANGYADGWGEDKRISVYWINKRQEVLDGQTSRRAFSTADRDSGTYRAFEGMDAYRTTFALVDRLAGKPVAVEAPTPKTPQRETPKLPDMPLNRILCGPPGTGKTFDAVTQAVETIDGSVPESRAEVRARFNELRDDRRVEFVTFHQNYAYEDFIEGIRPTLDEKTLRYELRDGIFKQIAIRASENRGERHVFIIDEINRGNIAKIFGELITLIEPSKRLGREDATEATLAYSSDTFGVPDNLYLIGTMNTADRGIALLDMALRRRFRFIERMPDVKRVSDEIEGVDGQQLLAVVNERIVEALDRDHQIGHTYLMDVASIEDLADAFQAQIIPLLQEYFYDDWEKMHRVLNDNVFITKRDAGERTVYDLLPRADERWQQAESYRAIYRGNDGDNVNDSG